MECKTPEFTCPYVNIFSIRNAFQIRKTPIFEIAINIDVFRTSKYIYVHFFYIIKETSNAISFRLPLLKKLFESLCCNLVFSYSRYFLTHWHPYWVLFYSFIFYMGVSDLIENGRIMVISIIRIIYLYIFIMPSFWDSYSLMSHGEVVSPKPSVWNRKRYCVKNATHRRRWARSYYCQWQRSFQRKLCPHWLEFSRERHVAVVRQGPVYLTLLRPVASILAIWLKFLRSVAKH